MKTSGLSRLLAWGWLALTAASALAEPTLRHYLSGTDKDHTVPWEFNISGGRRSGEWSTIPVPSNWEFQGFGIFTYGHDPTGQPAPTGNYRLHFKLPGGFAGHRIFLVFEGVMTGWVYPEYRGYFSGIRWATLKTTAGNLSLIIENPALYLRLLSYEQPQPLYGQTVVPFPSGDISFMHAIPAIGNKFNQASDPHSAAFNAEGSYQGTVWIRAGGQE